MAKLTAHLYYRSEEQEATDGHPQSQLAGAFVPVPLSIGWYSVQEIGILGTESEKERPPVMLRVCLPTFRSRAGRSITFSKQPHSV